MKINNVNSTNNFGAIQFAKGANMVEVAHELAKLGHKSTNVEQLSARAALDTMIEKNLGFGLHPKQDKIIGRTMNLEMDVFDKLSTKFNDIKLIP